VTRTGVGGKTETGGLEPFGATPVSATEGIDDSARGPSATEATVTVPPSTST
jgi:hypothetical protein